MHLFGLHHVFAIASDWRDCSDFYGLVLGLDRVSNPDGTLSFATAEGRDGPVLSFDVSPGAARGTPGRGLVHRLQWSVSEPGALELWRRRLQAVGVGVTAWLNGRGDPLALRFSDPDGLEHEMVLPPAFVLCRPEGDKGRTPSLIGVRAYAAASVQNGDLLAGRLGFASCGEGAWRVGAGEAAASYACDPPPPSRPVQGAGTVRHVAWSCRPGEERAWRQRVIGMGATVSRLIECDGYRCFFFREPDGVLFGVATRPTPAGAVQPRFQLPQPSEIPARIARPIGILAAV
ncbi:MAG TPA: VOC family protein [Solirubrobacterales bacterium]|nr:VOC family protein [Solirubrobacterales bacterium]